MTTAIAYTTQSKIGLSDSAISEPKNFVERKSLSPSHFHRLFNILRESSLNDDAIIPNEIAINESLLILTKLELLGYDSKFINICSMLDGGISLEFGDDFSYYTFDIYNNEEIIIIRKEISSNSSEVFEFQNLTEFLHDFELKIMDAYASDML